MLERADRGEEIVILRGDEVHARIAPATPEGKRPVGLCAHRLPDDLSDHLNPEQVAIDAGARSDDLWICQGSPAGDGSSV